MRGVKSLGLRWLVVVAFVIGESVAEILFQWVVSNILAFLNVAKPFADAL